MALPAIVPDPPVRRPQSPVQLAKVAVAKRFKLDASGKAQEPLTLTSTARSAERLTERAITKERKPEALVTEYVVAKIEASRKRRPMKRGV